MLEIPALGQPALLWLAQVPITDQVKELLEAFVETGTREEAVMATRALCGYQCAQDRLVQEVNKGVSFQRARPRVLQKQKDLGIDVARRSYSQFGLTLLARIHLSSSFG